MFSRLISVPIQWWVNIVLISGVIREVAGNVYSDDGKNFKCPLDPITDRYPDPTDSTCYHYFLCHLGRAFPQRCDPRRAFHPQLKSCQPRISIPENLCEQPYDCKDNGFVEDPEDCNKYYMCFFRQAIPYSCITFNYFDPKKRHCVFNKKKFKACAKPKPMRLPDPKRPEFTRIRVIQGGTRYEEITAEDEKPTATARTPLTEPEEGSVVE